MKRILLLAPCTLVLVACTKKDPHAPSVELFEQVINADAGAATQKICGYVSTGLIQLPKEYRGFEANGSDWTRYKALKGLGYVSIEKAALSHAFGGTVDGYRVSLTTKGRDAFGHEYDSKRCVGVWKAGKVKEFTVPAEVAGLKVSRVTVTGQQEYAGWASDPKVRSVLKMPDLPAEVDKTITLVLKNTGWQVLEGK